VVCKQEVNLEFLKQHLLRQLPEYMVPSHFEKMSQIPLTSNGKADRKALPEPTLNAKSS
jgi:non-ribosomal peptide synthetase component E (peptide arylation enzyme)